MTNRLSVSEGSPAHTFYLSAQPEDVASIDVALDCIQDAPFPDGDRITARYMAPVTVYCYQDSEWRITFGMGYVPSCDACDISVWAIYPAK